MKNLGRRILLFAIRFCVIAMLVGCVCLSLIPRATIALAFGVNDCCVGNSAGHCTIAIGKKRAIPDAEPMCGGKSRAKDNSSVTTNDPEDQPGSNAFKRPNSCNDCPTCTLASKQRGREKSIITSQQAIDRVTDSDCPQEISFHAIERLNPVRHIDLRGPPNS